MVAMTDARRAAIKMHKSKNGTHMEVPKVLKCTSCGKENDNSKFTNMQLYEVYAATKKAKLSLDCPEKGCGKMVYFVCTYKRKRTKPKVR
jgi:hypothetical protein